MNTAIIVLRERISVYEDILKNMASKAGLEQIDHSRFDRLQNRIIEIDKAIKALKEHGNE